jgi:hypothetical protein
LDHFIKTIVHGLRSEIREVVVEFHHFGSINCLNGLIKSILPNYEYSVFGSDKLGQ